jgi:hypothetical protein
MTAVAVFELPPCTAELLERLPQRGECLLVHRYRGGSRDTISQFAFSIQLISNDRSSYCDDAQFGIKAPHIVWVTRDHRMPRLLRANDNVRIGNVRRSAARQQRADSLSVASIQRYDIGAVTLDQTPETHLPCRITNDLRERRSRNDDSVPVLEGRRNQRKDPPVAALQRD